MVAYSFQRRFIPPILAGTKRQTIRADRKRHARPDEDLQLYTGIRTGSCALIGRSTCAAVWPITIHVHQAEIEVRGDVLTTLGGIDDFARSDGFEDWQDMRQFWEEQHRDVPIFSGWLIEWRRFRPC